MVKKLTIWGIHMIWADKLTIGLSALLLLLLMAVLSVPDIGGELSFVAFTFSLPVWIFLRIIDWLIGGPNRRERIRAESRVIHQVIDITPN